MTSNDPMTQDRPVLPPPLPGETPCHTGGSFSLFTLILGFVILADWLFFERPLGWTAGAFGLLLLGTLGVQALVKSISKSVLALTAVLGVLFLGYLDEPNRLSLALGVAGLVTLGLVIREAWVGDAVVWLRRWLAYATVGWLSLPGCVADHVAASRTNRQPGGGGRFIKRWLIPVALGAVFLGLFSAANPIISGWVSTAWEAVSDIFEQLPSFLRILFWVVVTLQVGALLVFQSGIREADMDFIEGELPEPLAGFLSPGTILRSLAVFNVLFGVQTVLDLCYLWGGTALPESMTYAHYAHRGAYPLIVTALLAAVFVLVTFRPGQASRDQVLSRRLVYAWLAQNVFLVISAAWRLWLYVDVYALTRLRVSAGIWMLLVACGLIWIVVRIATGRSNQWLINVNAFTAVAVLYVCSFMNFDGTIASFNVRHSEEILGKGHPAVDAEYLAELGYDSLPALLWLSGQVGDHPRAGEFRQTTEELKDRLSVDLENWRGWTWRRARLAAETVGVAPL